MTVAAAAADGVRRRRRGRRSAVGSMLQTGEVQEVRRQLQYSGSKK